MRKASNMKKQSPNTNRKKPVVKIESMWEVQSYIKKITATKLLLSTEKSWILILFNTPVKSELKAIKKIFVSKIKRALRKKQEGPPNPEHNA